MARAFLFLYFCYVLILVPGLYPYIFLSSSPTLHLYEKCFLILVIFIQQVNPNAIVETRESKRRILMRLGEQANPNAIVGTRESKRRIRMRCPRHKTKKCPSRPPYSLAICTQSPYNCCCVPFNHHYNVLLQLLLTITDHNSYPVSHSNLQK